MSVDQTDVIDFVAHDATEDIVLLVMVEARAWGDSGALLPELQEKFNTYLTYALDGQLTRDYPEMKGKPVRIVLRTSLPPGERELEFLRIVETRVLAPEKIQFTWKLIQGD